MAAKYTDVITTNAGTVLPGATVQLLDGSGALVTTYTDAALTQGGATEQVADSNGLVELYVADGTYTVRQSYNGVSKDLPNVELYDISTIATTSDGAVANKAQASAVGVAGTAENMGTYTGSTLSDNQTAKQNIQELETAVEARVISADLASTTAGKGAALVKFQSGKNVQELADGGAATGAALVGFLQSGTGAAARTAQEKLRDIVSIKDFGAVCDGVTDDTAAVQACVDYCLASDPPRSMKVPGPTRLTSSIIIDRAVDTTIGTFHIYGEGGGFYVDSAVTMIDTSLPSTTDPASEYVTFHNMQFEASDKTLAAYVMSQKFLRVRFEHCRFIKIKAVSSSIYLQSWVFNNNLFREIDGITIGAVGSAYNIVVTNNAWEFSPTGDGIDVGACVGCMVSGNIFEAGRRFFRQAGCNGLTISGNYTEANSAADVTLTHSGGIGRGIGLYGNQFATGIAGASVVVGDVRGMQSGGNYSNGALFDTTGTLLGEFVSVADVAIGNKFSTNGPFEGLANGSFAQNPGYTAHAGGGQADATPLTTPYNRVTTVASAGDSVGLPATDNVTTARGRVVVVVNAGANSLNVYYAQADVTNFGPGGGRATPFAVPAGSAATFVSTTAGNWVCLNRAAAQANSAASDVAGLVADFNSLLTKLRAAGVLEA